MSPVSPGEVPGLVRWARDGCRWVLRRVRPDHTTIRSQSMRPNHFGMLRLFVYAAVAPSRACPRPLDDQAARRAVAFSQRAAPDAFGDQPDVADGSRSLFFCEDSDGIRERALAVDRTGLVELLWSVELWPDTDGQLVLRAVDVVRPLLTLADAIAREEYSELSGLDRSWRRFGRVDWSFAMACAMSGSEGRKTWSRIELPGEQPPRATGHRGGEFPLQGIQAWSISRSAGQAAVGEFLIRLLLANGYHELGETVQATVLAATGEDGGIAAAEGRSSHAEPRSR